MRTVEQAEQLYRQGIAENSAGRPVRALRFLHRALRELADHPASEFDASDILRPRVELAIATAESELNGLNRGLRALAPVADYVAQAQDDRVRVLLQLHLGYMQVRGGNFRLGMEHLDAAVSLIEHADARSACNILLNRGMLRVYLGDLATAGADYRRAVEMAQENELLVEEVKARHNLGEVEFYAGNLALALRLMDEAASLQAEVSPAVALVDRAKVLLGAGLYRDADEALLQAGELFRANRLWKDVGEVELARAQCALLDGEIAAARRLAGSARDRFRRRGNVRWRRDAELVLLQADLAGGRPGARLAHPARRLAAEFSGEGLTARARSAGLIAVEATLASGQSALAEELAASIGPIRRDDSIAFRVHARLVRAKVNLATGRPADGRREIRAGLVELARHQAQFGSVDLQTAGAVHGRQLAELDLGLALRAGRPNGVLAAVERSRATSSRLPSVVAPRDEQVAALLAELRQVSEEVRATESDAAAVRLGSARRRRMAELQQQLRSRAWSAEGSRQAARVANFEETVAAACDRGASYLCYLEVAGRLHALVLGPTGNGVHDLGPAAPMKELVLRVRADLDVLARGQLPTVLRAAVTGSLRRSLQGLETGLITPLGLSPNRLVIAPSGVLATLPWGMLPALAGCPVTVTPSATAWVQASRAEDRTGPLRVTAFAGPDLAFAASEVAAIERIWGYGDAADRSPRPLARRADFDDAVTGNDLVHIAAHGEHQAENPLFSAIRLADGPVYAYELDSSRPVAGHVVLSSCELGQATVRPGDEALGLTSVLLRLGTRSVISGVARVNDQLASEVMIRYHRELAAGRDSAEALATACAGELGGDDGDPSNLPAPFVCFGASWSAAM
ncbi:MAG: hypothetical protein JWO63_596 [Frankiales bacterium]|nr:hypothetical protein [Frankiales bacterium]